MIFNDFLFFFAGFLLGLVAFYVAERVMLRLALSYVRKQANAKGNAVQAELRQRTQEAVGKALELAVQAKNEGKDTREIAISMLPVAMEYPDVVANLMKKVGR